MEWYPFYFNVFQSDTLHLTPYQDGCYRRLIDHYMRNRKPLPDNDVSLARIIGITEAEWVTHASGIVRAYFIQNDGVLRHNFCDKMLDEQDILIKRKSEQGKKAAKKRWSQPIENKKQNARGIGDPMQNDATRQDKTRHLDSTYLKIIGTSVSEIVAKDFCALRRSKKAPITKTVINGITREANKIGWTLEQALEEICQRGWIGFKAEWIQKGKSNEKQRIADETKQLLDGLRSS